MLFLKVVKMLPIGNSLFTACAKTNHIFESVYLLVRNWEML